MILKGFICSLDPAQAEDRATLSVLEVSRNDGEKVNTYRLKALNRKQHIPYSGLVDWSKKTFSNPKFRIPAMFPPIFICDSSGIGRIVMDDLKVAGVPCRGIGLHAGKGWSHEGKDLRVSKPLLVSIFLRTWYQQRVLMPLTASFFNPFKNELKDFRRTVGQLEKVKFEHERGKRDDMILSIAQAIWFAEMFIKPRRQIQVPSEVAAFAPDLGSPRSVDSYFSEAYNSEGYLDYKRQIAERETR